MPISSSGGSCATTVDEDIVSREMVQMLHPSYTARLNELFG